MSLYIGISRYFVKQRNYSSLKLYIYFQGEFQVSHLESEVVYIHVCVCMCVCVCVCFTIHCCIEKICRAFICQNYKRNFGVLLVLTHRMTFFVHLQIRIPCPEGRSTQSLQKFVYSFKCSQQDSTLYNILYYCRCFTYFVRFLRPSSGAQKLYTQHLVYAKACLLLPLAVAASKPGIYQMLCVKFLGS